MTLPFLVMVDLLFSEAGYQRYNLNLPETDQFMNDNKKILIATEGREVMYSPLIL